MSAGAPPNILWNELRVNYSYTSALAFAVHGLLITLDDEVACIWSKPQRSWTKWLFVLVRYLPIIFLFSLQFDGNGATPAATCTAWNVWQSAGLQILLAAVDIILMLRIYAMYGRAPVIRALLILLFVLANAAMSASLATSVPAMRWTPDCILLTSPPGILYFGIASFVMETVLFLLTVWKVVGAVREGWGRAPIVALLLRDGAWAFAVIFLSVAANAACFLLLSDALASVAFPWVFALPGFAACRLVLNLHQVDTRLGRATEGREDGEGMTSTQIEFTTRFDGDGYGYGVSGTGHYDLPEEARDGGDAGRARVWRPPRRMAGLESVVEEVVGRTSEVESFEMRDVS